MKAMLSSFILLFLHGLLPASLGTSPKPIAALLYPFAFQCPSDVPTPPALFYRPFASLLTGFLTLRALGPPKKATTLPAFHHTTALPTLGLKWTFKSLLSVVAHLPIHVNHPETHLSSQSLDVLVCGYHGSLNVNALPPHLWHSADMALCRYVVRCRPQVPHFPARLLPHPSSIPS
uniref:Putative secreted protein n=1 Tax=Ixodes ricinus TaxID=34613 RepID=A0A6B0UZL8_IXORI